MQLWSPKGDRQLIDLANDYFIAKFAASEDRDWALAGGPWLVQGHYLTIREWIPDFQPYDATIDKAAVWVRVPNMPMEYQNEVILRRIGYGLGQTLKIDRNTVAAVRGNFARIFVEINLDKPLKPSISILNQLYRVEYKVSIWFAFSVANMGIVRRIVVW